MAAFSRFISRSAEHGLPFFKLLKGETNFSWGQESQGAFEELKKIFDLPSITAKPQAGLEPTAIPSSYPIRSKQRARLRTEIKENSIYYVSEILQGAKT